MALCLSLPPLSVKIPARQGGWAYPDCMASGQGGRPEPAVTAGGSTGLAKPLYLQRLERSLRLESFLHQTATIFNRDVTRYCQTSLLYYTAVI